jgi:hypothetical protein
MYRVSVSGLPAARALAAADELGDLQALGDRAGSSARSGVMDHSSITQGLLRLHAVQAEIAARHQSLAKGFIAGHPEIPTVEVPAASGDIHDLVGLRQVGSALAGLSGD